MKKMLKEFKEFAMRGNVVDMAVGIMIGGAFSTIVKSLVDDVLMPPIGVVLGGVDLSRFFFVLKQGTPSGPYLSVAEAKTAGAATLNYGMFVNAVISFLLIAWATFLIVRSINRLRREGGETKAEPTTKTCEYCISSIPVRARKCPHCTSVLS